MIDFSFFKLEKLNQLLEAKVKIKLVKLTEN